MLQLHTLSVSQWDDPDMCYNFINYWKIIFGLICYFQRFKTTVYFDYINIMVAESFSWFKIIQNYLFSIYNCYVTISQSAFIGQKWLDEFPEEFLNLYQWTYLSSLLYFFALLIHIDFFVFVFYMLANFL